MDGTFNGQILTEKLTKLNSTQQSIETLSHWCIFHRKKARQVVEIWDRQFHCSPRGQRVPFLFLANDILQNSRRKGFEFAGEFWNVLPDALNDVYKNGDEAGRKAVLRLVGIWEERKVFGSRGQILREEILGRNADNLSKTGKASYKLKKPGGEIVQKLISSYERVHDNLVNEDNLFGRCHNAISYVEKMEKEIANENLGNIGGPGAVEELQEQHGALRECIEQLMIAESSRVNLVTLLNEATREQETVIERIRNQLQVTQLRYEQAGNIYQQLQTFTNGQLPLEQRPNEPPPPTDIQPTSSDVGKSTPVRYVQQSSFTDNSPQSQDDHRKSAAAAMAERLTSSTSSAQMLSYVLSSLASEGVLQSAKEDYPSDHKRSKLENGTTSYIPPPPPSYPHPDSLLLPPPPPPPPQSSPMQDPSSQLQAPPPPPPYMQTAGAMMSVPYTYGSALPPMMPPPPPPPPPFGGYPMVGMSSYYGPPNPYHNFQGSEGGLFNHAPLPPTPPSVTRQ